MKKEIWILIVLLLGVYTGAVAQTMVVTDDPTYVTGEASSVLELKSNSKGFLPPRMAETERISILTPSEGLVLYQTDSTRGFYYFDGSVWKTFASGIGSQWINSGDNIYYNQGNVGIGTNNPTNRLHVSGMDPLRLDSLRHHTTEIINFLAIDTNGIVLKSDFFLSGVSTFIKATYILDVPLINNNSNVTFTIYIPGAQIGDIVITTPSDWVGNYGGIIISYSWVLQPDWVAIHYNNVANYKDNPVPMEYYILLAR